jgi:hypothetical protein
MARVLNQVIAIVKGVKGRVMSRCNELHNQLQAEALLNGSTREYAPMTEGDTIYPKQEQIVQVNAIDHLKEMADLTAELFDAEAALDYANCSAKADVIVDGTVILSGVPATYLIFLEKSLLDLHTTLAKAAVLKTDKRWKFDELSRLFLTDPEKTIKTKKVEKHIVVVPATVEHPAQVAKVTEDIAEGTWTNTQMSGAMSPARLKLIRDRVQRLIDAVKVAREQANMVAAPEVAIGRKVMAHIFA